MTRRRRCCPVASSALLLAALSAAPDAGAQPGGSPPDPLDPAAPPIAGRRYEPQGTQLVVVEPNGSRRAVELGCQARQAVSFEEKVYVACGAAGVVVLGPAPDGSLRPLHRIPAEGEVVEVFVKAGRLWAEVHQAALWPVTSTTARLGGPGAAGAGRPADAGEPGAMPGEPGGASPVLPGGGPRVGRVVATEPGEVIVDVGAADGVTVGMRVKLSVRRQREMDEGYHTVVEEKLAVGEVTEVAPDRTRIQLGLNEDVPPDAEALPTQDELTSSLVAPPRPSDQWHLGFHVRPFLTLGDLAFGMLSTVEVGYRGEADWHLRALAEPLGFVAGKDQAVGAVSVFGAASYDHPLFEIGAGLGATRLARMDRSDTSHKMAFTLVPLLRLGALDGLHLEVHNGFVVANEKFDYGSTTGTFQIPLARAVALQFRGGGGVAGYGFGEAGLRVLALGNGGDGTLFVSPSLGAAFMWGDYDCEEGPYGRMCDDHFYGGPMIGLGLEYRL